jgi:mannose-6-phosphate isomerase
MEILKLSPVLKYYIWAGDRLTSLWGKKSDNPFVAESWEMSAHTDGKSVVCGGKFNGKTLEEVISAKDLGEAAKKYDRFPLLIKFIDAGQNLSVQVHPDNEYALKNENDYGKTEAWYICDCEKGSGIYLGFKEDVTREQVRQAIEDNTVENLLNFIPVKKGEGYLIKAGTIHAICAGLTICEIQQNSNVTYRVYDYGRKDKEGKSRQLHVDKALDVLDYKKYKPEKNEKGVVADCSYFNITRYRIETAQSFECDGFSFNAVNIIEGSGLIDNIPFTKGDTFFVPAGTGKFTVKGKAEILITHLN